MGQALLTRLRVEAFSIHVFDDHTGFAMELSGSPKEPLRLDFAPWMVHQLLRVLPHIDASLQHQCPRGAVPLMAYPLAAWSMVRNPGGTGVALHLRDSRSVDCAFVIDREKALALREALDAALDAPG